MTHLLKLFHSTLIVSLLSHSNCQTWISANNKYLMVNTDQSSFVSAQQYCSDHFGSSLAGIHSLADNNEAYSLCAAHVASGKLGCRIGLYQPDPSVTDSGTAFSSWSYIDGSPFDWMPDNWGGNEPQGGTVENCAALWCPSGSCSQWVDVKCFTSSNYYIFCNYPTPSPTSVPTTAPTIDPTTSPTTTVPTTTIPTTTIPTTTLPTTTVPTTTVPTTTAPTTTAPTPMPAPMPSKSPTPAPTALPTDSPSNDPTNIPTEVPTTFPTREPTQIPTYNPTQNPSNEPTKYPTWHPTKTPTSEPTPFPTKEPSVNPISPPSGQPTYWPSEQPTQLPTNLPTNIPTDSPTHNLSDTPTYIPTYNPTNNPMSAPTSDPSSIPTPSSTQLPSNPTFGSISNDTTINPTTIPIATSYPTEAETININIKELNEISYGIKIRLSMDCIKIKTDNIFLNETILIKSILTDLIQTQDPNTQIDSIQITIINTTECKYIITTKVICDNSEDVHGLISYTNNINGLTNDFTNELKAEIAVDDVDINIELIETPTVTQIYMSNDEKPSGYVFIDILNTHLLTIVITVPLFFICLCICCGFILFAFNSQKKQLEMDKIKVQQYYNNNNNSNTCVGELDEIDFQVQLESANLIPGADLINDGVTHVHENEAMHMMEIKTKANTIVSLKSWFDENINIPTSNRVYYQLFVDNGYETADIVQLLTPDKLQQMGIEKQGHIDKIMMEIDNLKHRTQLQSNPAKYYQNTAFIE